MNLLITEALENHVIMNELKHKAFNRMVYCMDQINQSSPSDWHKIASMHIDRLSKSNDNLKRNDEPTNLEISQLIIKNISDP